MIDISENLQTAIEADVKKVTPVVTARLADNRFLDNLTISSSSENYENLILRKSPKLYWRFNEWLSITDTADLSENPINGSCTSISTTDSPITRVEEYISVFGDDFTRSNSTDEPGFLSGNPNVSWQTNDKGLWGISSNKLYVSEWDESDWETPGYGIKRTYATCVIDIGAFNGYFQYTFKTTPANASQHGVCLRYIDDRNFIGWKFIYSAGFHVPLFFKVVDGTYTAQAYVFQSMAVDNIVKFEFIDDQIIAYKNGVQFDSYAITDSIFLDESVTKCGLMIHDSTGASLANSRWGEIEAASYNTVDRAFSFNGTSSYVSASDIADLNITEDFSLSFWFNNSDVSGTQYILRMYDNASDKFGAYLDGSELNVYVEDNASTRYTLNSIPATANEWHFATFVKSGENIYLYINGVLTNSSVMTEYIKDQGTGLLMAGAYDQTPTNPFAGSIDEIAIFNSALTSKYVEMLYKSSSNTGRFIGSGGWFKDEQASNGIPEETFSYAVTDSKTEYGSIISSCGEYVALPSEYDINKEFAWWSRTKSDVNGIFQEDEIMWTEFDSRYANKIILSTGYIQSRLRSIDYYLIDENDVETVTTAYFDYDNSILEIDIDEAKYKAFGVQMNSTWNSECHGVLNEFNLIWDVDVSNQIISFDFEKVRDNYDSTLPIGLTSANNGSITLNNTDKDFNPYGDSIYADYILPDVELFISLRYEISDTSEEDIVVASNVFIDEWNVDSSSMTVSGSFRDYSKYIQEETMPSGFLFLNSSAGRGIKNIMKLTQFPSRRIFSWDTYYNTMWQSRPWAMWRMSDLTTTVEDHGGRYDAQMSGTGYEQGILSILPQEYDAISLNAYRNELGYLQINNLDDNNRNVVYCTSFDGTADTKASVTNDELSMVNNWSIEAIVQPSSLPINIGDRYAIVSKQDSSNDYNYLMFIEKTSADGYVVGAEMTNSASTLYTSISDEFSYLELVGENIHIAAVRNGTWLFVALNGDIYDITDVGANSCHTNSDPLTIAGLQYSVSGSKQEFVGKIGPITFWNRPLNEAEILNHYTTSLLSGIYIFPYLFGKDSTPWDAMLNIATADLGMFYFDENGDFQYDYLNTLHESALSQHQDIQYELSDAVNIIAGTQPINIQINKVTVMVNPKKAITNNYQSIWRAESGESLVVTTLAEDITPNQTSILVTDTEAPIWLKSGYAKINDEIIFYGNRQNNQLIEIQRGQFGTEQSSHSNGDLCRETRVYDIEYTGGPATGIKFPFLTAKDFDGTADIDEFTTGPFVAKIIVSANESNAEGDIVILEGKNPVTELENYFSVAGIVFEEKSSNKKVTKQIRDIQDNIRRFHVKELTIDNEFIQEEAYAAKIADFIIRFFGLPIQILNIEVSGLPQLQLGDLVEVSSFDQLDIQNRRYWIISSSLSYDGGISHSLSLREYTEGL